MYIPYIYELIYICICIYVTAQLTSNTHSSQDTVLRALSSGVELLPTLEALVSVSDAILSIVPPADALATAQAVIDALSSSPDRTADSPLYYLDLNAISPSSARSMETLFSPVIKDGKKAVSFIDGAIIGSPPTLSPQTNTWSLPQIPTSGPTQPPPYLSAALGTSHLDDRIGSASGLKMCFASLTKGLTAIAVQAFATAHRMGVRHHLDAAIEAALPGMGDRIERGVTGCPPKAGRWVGEMEEIAETHAGEGGWGGTDMFSGAAEVYRVLAGTELGREKVGERRRGVTVEDVAAVVAEELGWDGEREKVEGE
jgi:hypothetical protein